MGHKFVLPTVFPPGRIQAQPAYAVLFDADESWISDTQLARAVGYIEPLKMLTGIPLAKTVNSFVSLVSGTPEKELAEAHLTGTLAGRHIFYEMASHFVWGGNSPDVNSLGNWTMPPPSEEPEEGPPGRQARGKRPARAASSGSTKKTKASGAQRGPASSSAGHYNVKYTETEQLMFRSRGMEGLRVACRSLVTDGREITPAISWDEVISPPDKAPPELCPYYGKVGAPCFPGAPTCVVGPSGADLPRQAWRNARLPPWIASSPMDSVF
jgi:hypothetical protein